MSNQRIQFELSEEMALSLTRLMDDFGVRTKKDLFNNSISLLQWVSDELKNGKKIGSIEPDSESYSQLMMPIFSNVKKIKSDQDRAA